VQGCLKTGTCYDEHTAWGHRYAEAAHVPGRTRREDQPVKTGITKHLFCDDERIRRWEAGAVRWPSPAYQATLREVTGLLAGQLGFLPPDLDDWRRVIEGRITPPEAFPAETELFDTMDLARIVTASDLGPGAVNTLQETADLPCRACPSAPATELLTWATQRLSYTTRLLHSRTTLLSIASLSRSAAMPPSPGDERPDPGRGAGAGATAWVGATAWQSFSP